MFEPIKKISNLKKFKQQLFDGKIFVFKKSKISSKIIQEIKDKINIEISYASKTAIEKVEKNGGTITLTVK